MPQMFPMNWWMLSLIPLMMIVMILMNMHFNKKNMSMKLKNNKQTMLIKTLMWMW